MYTPPHLNLPPNIVKRHFILKTLAPQSIHHSSPTPDSSTLTRWPHKIPASTILKPQYYHSLLHHPTQSRSYITHNSSSLIFLGFPFYNFFDISYYFFQVFSVGALHSIRSKYNSIIHHTLSYSKNTQLCYILSTRCNPWPLPLTLQPENPPGPCICYRKLPLIIEATMYGYPAWCVVFAKLEECLRYSGVRHTAETHSWVVGFVIVGKCSN